MSFAAVRARSELVRRMLEDEARRLHPAAMPTAQSRGRRHAEPPHAYRTEYQRDRDRIIHAAAFRRLGFKTQVFTDPGDDHTRSRLTHTLEVVQIARTISRALRLNEDLTEAIALVHDLGHPPFGHAGERVLQRRMAEHGGFEHNRQGLRLVEQLERRYPTFPGLNLTFEVLQSQALRCHDLSHPSLREFEPNTRGVAEAQVVDASDSIAYDTHDVDDALRIGLIGFDDLRTIELWRRAEEQVRSEEGELPDGKVLTRAMLRSLVDMQVSSVVEESHRRLSSVHSLEQVRAASEPVIAAEPELPPLQREMERFLFERVYRHPQVVRAMRAGEAILEGLFDAYLGEPALLPGRFASRLEHGPRERVVCDYISTMTDRHARQRWREQSLD